MLMMKMTASEARPFRPMFIKISRNLSLLGLEVHIYILLPTSYAAAAAVVRRTADVRCMIGARAIPLLNFIYCLRFLLSIVIIRPCAARAGRSSPSDGEALASTRLGTSLPRYL